MPRLGPKAAEMKQAFTIPKGIPKREEYLDDKGVKKLAVGQRHSAVVTGIWYCVLICFRGWQTLHFR